VVLAEQGDADAAGVEPGGVAADDRAVDAARAPLVDGAEPVDEEVVRDVAPPVEVHVVVVDATDEVAGLGRE
jgi:hypothetical protein